MADAAAAQHDDTTSMEPEHSAIDTDVESAASAAASVLITLPHTTATAAADTGQSMGCNM